MNRSLQSLCLYVCLIGIPCVAETNHSLGLTQLPSSNRATIVQVLSKAQLLASDGVTNNEFGTSVAVSSSGKTIVVGAAAENAYSGAVYVFVEPVSGWSNATQTTKLTVPGGQTGAEFGQAVAISSNGSLVAVAAPEANSTGAVYLFSPTGGNWSNGGTLVAALSPSDGIVGDYLGSSLAISSNGQTVVAGAVNVSITDQDQGAVYVFTEPAGGWKNETEAARLTASDPVNNQNLGNSVSISGSTVAAGAWDYALGSGGNGAVYVYTKPAAGWSDMTQTAKLTASDGKALDTLGTSVSISGSTIAAGAPGHKVGSNADQGAVYVFVEPAGGWVNAVQNAELTSSNGIADSVLGSSVAMSASIIVTGAYCQKVGSNACQGELYGYLKPAGGWVNGTEAYDLTAKGGAAGDELGWSASLTSTGPIAIGSSLGYKSYTGAVYVFEK